MVQNSNLEFSECETVESWVGEDDTGKDIWDLRYSEE